MIYSRAIDAILRPRFLQEAAADLKEALLACLPDSWRRWLLRRDIRLVITVRDEERAEVTLVTGDKREHIYNLECSGHGAPSLPIPVKQRERMRIVLELPTEAVLRRTITLPSQVRDNLAQVMRNEIDRFSPFQADQIYFDCTPLSNMRSDWLAVHVALCRRDRVHPWLDRLQRIGLPVDLLTWPGAWRGANLLAMTDRPSRKARFFNIEGFMAALVFVLLIGVIATPLWQRQRILERLEGDLRSARARVVEVDEVRKALEQARAGSAMLLREKAERTFASDLLRELTERLPDDTWVRILNMREGEVDISGESERATALIELLEASQGFNGVSFRSPVTQDAQTGNERFHLSFRLPDADRSDNSEATTQRGSR